MIDLLLKSKQPGKWRTFIDALIELDYPYLVQLFTSNTSNHEDDIHQRTIIKIFAPYLLQILNPLQLVHSLIDAFVINDHDVQNILARQRNEGAIAATMVLLERIQDRLHPYKWYTKFLQVLHQAGHSDIVKEMEPDFTTECDVLKYPQIKISEPEPLIGSHVLPVTEAVIEDHVLDFRDELTVLIDVENIMPYIASDLLSNDSLKGILELSQQSGRNAMDMLLDELLQLKSDFKWTRFIICLRKSGYSYMADVLSRHESNQQFKQINVLKIFSSTLENQIDPLEVLPYLIKEGVINDWDKEHIVSIRALKGNIDATICLLDCLERRRSPAEWHRAFITALLTCGYEDIASLIDPDMCRKFEQDQSHSVSMENMTSYHSNVHTDLDRKLSAALQDIRKTDIRAKHEVKILRNHFNRLENDLLNNLKETVDTQREPIIAAKRLVLQSKETIQRMPNDDNEAHETDALKTEIQTVLKKHKNSKPFVVVPSSAMLEISTLGTVQEHFSSSQESFAYAEQLTVPFQGVNSTRLQIFRQHTVERVRSSSSESSASSGFVKVSGHLPKKPFNRTNAISCEIIPETTTSHSGMVNNNHLSVIGTKPLTFNEAKASSLSKRRWRSKSESMMGSLNESELDMKKYFLTHSKPKLERVRHLSESGSLSTDSSFVPASTISNSVEETNSLASQETTGFPYSTITDVPSRSSVSISQNDDSKSLVFHNSVCFSQKHGDCQLSDMCILASQNTVIVDQNHACLIVHNESLRTQKEFQISKHIPIRVCSFHKDTLHVLFSRRNRSETLLIAFAIERETLKKGKTIVVGFRKLKTLQCSCNGKLSCIRGGKGRLYATCFDKHLHIFNNESDEISFVTLKESLNERESALSSALEWWPHYISVNQTDDCLFVYDIFSECVYCFEIANGILRWKRNVPGIEGIVSCDNQVFLAQNRESSLLAIALKSPYKTKTMRDNCNFPFALGTTSRHDTIIMTQFKSRREKLTRTVKWF